MNHYERLGIARDATARQVRDAYRRAARAVHPDRHGNGSAAAMAAVNEAWRVLGDPARRRVYDETLRAGEAVHGTAGSAAGARRSTDARPGGAASYGPVVRPAPAGVPWKFIGGLAVSGIAVLAVGYAVTDPPPPAAPDNILRPGDCVALSAVLDATEVMCTGPHDAVVQVLVPFDAECPNATEPYRDRQGMGTACVVRVSP